MIQFHDEQNHRESMLMPLLFTSYDNYLWSSKSVQVSLNWIEKFCCQKPTKHGQFMLYVAVKNDLANSKEASFNNTISSTLSLIIVLFDDLFKAVNYKRYYVVKRTTLNHPSHHWIKPIHVMDMTLTLISSMMMSTMHSKKNRWCCLRVIASLVLGIL